jgi:hypothetical protein
VNDTDYVLVKARDLDAALAALAALERAGHQVSGRETPPKRLS